MSGQVLFVSGSSNLNIVKKKGAIIQRAVPGGSVSEVTPTSWIKFRKHKYIAKDPEEIEIIRQHIRDYPIDRITEFVPQTPQDILKEKEIKAVEAARELEEARRLAGKVDTPEKVVEETPNPQEEQRVYTETCSDCDWVAKSSTSEAQAKSKLRGHRAAKHRTVQPIRVK